MVEANRESGTDKQDAKSQFADLRVARVMVVDDNRVNRHLLLALLREGEGKMSHATRE